MRAYCTSKKSIKAAVNQAVKQEWQNYEQTVFEQCKRDILAQVMAVCLMSLKTRYGFGQKRITDFYYDVKGTFYNMDKGLLGQKYTTVDCIKYVKDNYGIDLDEDMKAEK